MLAAVGVSALIFVGWLQDTQEDPALKKSLKKKDKKLNSAVLLQQIDGEVTKLENYFEKQLEILQDNAIFRDVRKADEDLMQLQLKLDGINEEPFKTEKKQITNRIQNMLNKLDEFRKINEDSE